MIEHSKLIDETTSDHMQIRPARVKRETMLKEKIAVILNTYPDKSLRVIRRWLQDEPRE